MSDEVFEIEDAQSEFVRIGDIDGRDVVVFPQKITLEKGDGDKFPALWADVIVLNGPTTSLITEVPFVVTKMMLTSSPMVRNGERMLAKQGNEPFAKPFSGKVNSRKGQKGGRAYGIEAWDKDSPIRSLANAEAAKYIRNRPSVIDDADEFGE